MYQTAQTVYTILSMPNHEYSKHIHVSNNKPGMPDIFQ